MNTVINEGLSIEEALKALNENEQSNFEQNLAIKEDIELKDIEDPNLMSGDYISIRYKGKEYPARVISKTNDSVEYEISGYGFYKHGMKLIPGSKEYKIFNTAKDLTEVVGNVDMEESESGDNDETLTEATKKQLDSFAVKVKKELGGKFKVVSNSRTQCADILDNEDNIIGQAYPKFHTIETEKPITVKRLIRIKSVDEIQSDDEIYVKRSETSNMKKVADQIDYIKMVHGIVDSADVFIASVNKANDIDDLAMNTDNRN